MPELAEVEFFRRRWSVGHGAKVTEVLVHPRARIFRTAPAADIVAALTGATLVDSAAAAKQMLFKFSSEAWLGLHLGMSGELRVAAADHMPAKHEHLVLRQAERSLVFSDPRMFGGLKLHRGTEPPAWWTKLPPAILSTEFTREVMTAFLRRRARAPIKAVLLMQERFPGVGNWMADEILWRARVRPSRRAGKLSAAEVAALFRECRFVCRGALRYNAGVGGPLPHELNEFMPDSWLFNHRWARGGECPRCDAALRYDEVGGRTSCWCAACQK